MTVVQLVVQMLLQFVVAPVVLRFAGQDALGAYAAIVQCLAYMLAIDVGFYSAMAKYLAEAYGREGVGAGFMRVMNTARVFIVVMNVAYAIAIAALASQAGAWLNLPVTEAAQARSGLLMLAGWTLLRIPLLSSSFALLSVQDLAARNAISVLGSVVRFGTSLALVAFGFGLTGLIIGYIGNEMVEYLGCRWRFDRLHPQARSLRAPADRGLLMELLKLSGSTLLIMVGSRFLFFSDNMIVGLLTSAAAASVYYTTQLPGTFGWMTINRLTDNASPAINEMYGRSATAQMQALYLRMHRYIQLLAVPFGIGVLLFNGRIVTLWVGPDQFGGNLINVGLACLTVVVTLGWVDYSFLLAAGRIRAYAFIFFGAGLLKFGLSVICCRLWGPAGVMIATVPAALVYAVYGQVAVRAQLGIGFPQFLRASLAPVVLPAIVTAAITGTVAWQWPAGSWVELIGQCGLFAVVYLPLAWRSLPEEERVMVGNRMKAKSGKWGNRES